MTSVAHPMVMEGVQLMLIGMGTVFVFLTLLVVAVRTMSALILMYFPPVPIQTNKAVVTAEGVPGRMWRLSLLPLKSIEGPKHPK